MSALSDRWPEAAGFGAVRRKLPKRARRAAQGYCIQRGQVYPRRPEGCSDFAWQEMPQPGSIVVHVDAQSRRGVCSGVDSTLTRQFKSHRSEQLSRQAAKCVEHIPVERIECDEEALLDERVQDLPSDSNALSPKATACVGCLSTCHSFKRIADNDI